MTDMEIARQVDSSIALIPQATRLLERARTFEEVRNIRDTASSIKHFLKKHKASRVHLHQAAVLTLDCERKLGEFLDDLITKGRKSEMSHDVTFLIDIGISRNDSMKYQRIASIPDAEFEAYVQTTYDEGQELTRAGVLRLWRSLNTQGETAQPDQPRRFDFVTELNCIREWLIARCDSWPDDCRPGFWKHIVNIAEQLGEQDANG